MPTPFPLSVLTLVKLAVILLGLFNLALTLKGTESTPTDFRQLHIRGRPDLTIRHLDTPTMRPRMLFTEETVHYPINGTLAEREWASLVPAENHGVVVIGPDARPYAIGMFHSLHCLDRVRQAIVSPEKTTLAQYHVQHCFNYLRQMVLCAANTRLNPTIRHESSGEEGTDGIGLMYECRDWDKVYEAFKANYALNRTMSFPR